jgi:hypothetical protein
MLIRRAVEKKIQKINITNLIISLSSVVIDKYGMETDTTDTLDGQKQYLVFRVQRADSLPL